MTITKIHVHTLALILMLVLGKTRFGLTYCAEDQLQLVSGELISAEPD